MRKITPRILTGAKVRAFVLALVLLLLTNMIAPLTVYAQGGLAISGSFYQQVFIIPQGSSVNGPSVDLVVFNTGSDPLNVKMATQVPLGVIISLSNSDFVLAPGGSRQVMVRVEVAKDATPGEYDLGISAEPYSDPSGGIRLASSAEQTARLVITGESCTVSIQATNPEGKPVVSTLRLFRYAGGESYEVGYSRNGTMDKIISPGDFTAVSYIAGQKVAEENFNVAAGQTKLITLSGATVFFEDFGMVPNSQKESGKLAFIQLVYTVKNLYQKVDGAEVLLSVSVDGAEAKEISLITLSPLEIGRAGLNYNYIPAEGWQDGTYIFKLQLKLDGQSYAFSPEQQVKVAGGVVSDQSQGGGVSLPVIIGIAAGAVIAALGIVLLLKRRQA